MDAVTGYILTGALAGGSGSVINMLLWVRTLRHTRILGIPLHKGFAHTISGALAELPEHVDRQHVQQLEDKILEVFDTFMSERLTQKMPVLSMFMDDKLIAEIREVFHAEMQTHLPALLMDNVKDERNIIAITQLMSRAVSHGLKKYTRHAIAYICIGGLVGGALGYLMSTLL